MPTTDRSGRARGRRRRAPRRWPLAGCIVVVLVALALVVGTALTVRLLPSLLPAQCTVAALGGGQVGLDPEQAANAATITAVAVHRRLPQRASVIAIATAMQESKLRNLDYGDRDSLGLFQQRPSQGWGNPAQVRDPLYAAERFYDHLVKVPDWQTRPLTDVAQDVQRSGFPEAYAKHEDDATVVAEGFLGLRSGAVTCRLDPVDGPAHPQAIAEDLAAQIGVRPQVADDRILVRTNSENGARAVASWAVAHAQAREIQAVSVAGRTWTRGRDDAARTWAADATPGSDTRGVVIHLPRP